MGVAVGPILPALTGLNWASITRVFWRAVREPPLRRARKLAILRPTTPCPLLNQERGDTLASAAGV